MKRRIFRARISLSFVNFNFLERNRELSLNNRERTIGKPINQISIDISFEPGIYSSHSVAPDKNRGGKLRGNIETGVSIIAAKMSDGVSAHASVCALGSYVARPLKKKKTQIWPDSGKRDGLPYWKQFTLRWNSRYNATWFLSIKVEQDGNRGRGEGRGRRDDRAESEKKKQNERGKKEEEKERRGRGKKFFHLLWCEIIFLLIDPGREGNKGWK